MQILSQGSGSPIIPHGFDKFGSYARFKKPNASTNLNPLLKRISNEKFYSQSQYTNHFSIRKSRENQKENGRHASLENRYSKNLSINDYKDFALPNLNKFQISYGRGRGMRNLGYGKMYLDGNALASKDWKPGSLLRTSSELQVCYLDNVSSLIPDMNSSQIVKKSYNLRSTDGINKSPASFSSKSPDSRPNSLLYTPAKSESKYTSVVLTNQRKFNLDSNIQNVEKSTRDIANMK